MPAWTCPFCNQNATLIEKNLSVQHHVFNNENKYGPQLIETTVIVCPNTDCKEYCLQVSVYKAKLEFNEWRLKEEVASWDLIPASAAKVFPDYVPQPIINDYNEACLIRKLSPKASATLARRCLQGTIKDFWQIRKNRLVDEIEAIQDKIDPLTWQAIDAVRHVGNIGAHMEKDINLLIDVEPEEAGLLIGLIEMLIKDWYVLRHEREERLKAVVKLSNDKRAAKNPTP